MSEMVERVARAVAEAAVGLGLDHDDCERCARAAIGAIAPRDRIVSVVEHKGRLFMATERCVYQLIDGIWHPMVFAGVCWTV